MAERKQFWFGAARCSVESEERHAVVGLDGEVDVLATGLLAKFLGSLDVDELVLDLAEVSFFDASGLTLLIDLQKRFGPAKPVALAGRRGLVLRAPSRSVTRLLDIAALRGEFNILDGAP